MTHNDGVQIRIIILEAGEHLESVIRKVEKGWVVRFKRGSSLLGKKVAVYTSITPEVPLEWSEGNDHLSVHCQVECQQAGSFRYFFNVEESKEEGSGYFLVMPSLQVNGKALELDGICCQTYLTKLLGPLPEWKNRLRIAHESGYNMIHLTPIQELGVSNSSYSLSDHHGLVKTLGSHYGFEDIRNLVEDLEKTWGLLTVQDVVWNHAAKNATWLLEHPESAYNCLNSPHLRPAYVIDRVYHEFGKQVGEGVWEHRGVPPTIENIHHVNAIEYLLRAEVLPKAELHEFYQVDLKAMTNLFEIFIKQAGGPTSDPLDGENLEIIQDPEYRRFGNTVDFERSARIFNRLRGDANSEEERVTRCVQSFKDALHQKNLDAARESWEVILAGLQAVMGGITYERIAENGPKKGLVSAENPLTTDYFLHLEADLGWKNEEHFAFDPEKSKLLMAFNGWVMSSDPMKNFALKDSQVYLRRELVCWGDSVKLNYGDKEEDSPFLWQYMKEYTQKTASIFHGLRIDNAHGTPIHVAENLLKVARQVRPDVYVFAELFTGSEYLDNVFVNRLGISSLIREAQSAHDSHEQGRLVYRYGGDCVGAFKQKSARLAPNSIAHGLFLDQSHDNPSPIHTRSPFDILPTAAMLSMASCAVGSNRGYDELVRNHIHVVSETRPYASWPQDITEKQGIIKGRKILNDLHKWLAQHGYNQVFVDQMNPDIVGITRHNPLSHETVIVVSHTSFSKNYVDWPQNLKHIPIGGVLENVLFEMKLNQIQEEWDLENQEILMGLKNFEMEIRENINFSEGNMFKIHNREYIELTNFPTGSVIGFKVRPSDDAASAFQTIYDSIGGTSDAPRWSSCRNTRTGLQNTKSLAHWNEVGLITRTGVDDEWTWAFWSEKIKLNFEKEFYVDSDTRGEFVNRREILKDSVGSSEGFTDFQLRPNFGIALAVAPDLMNPKNAWKALNSAEVLLGPLGIKTLDPTDWAYSGFYNNDDDGTDKKTAKGWNYHQGPEWLFVAGFYLQARLNIGLILGGPEKRYAIRQTQERLGNAYKHIMNSPWRSLPELTNSNGENCRQSCDAQAWSVGCLIEACTTLNALSE
ncbi:hypothetical protein CAEBREN_28219 [Caenorhabditis brenneri]|uniref:Glycogen debranching enzyme n=1 Tax=Caenorhabditis brenneri TaxID=135651 RepID=G0N6Z0_CAEBE|nr:hypothetical protein CAEBREN_28219 [Caenorhabditis brenneri]